MKFVIWKYILPLIILFCTACYPIHKHVLRRGAGATSVAACSACLEGTYSNGTGAHMYLRCMKCFVLWILTWSWTQTLLGLDGWFAHTICIHTIDQNRIVFFKLVNKSLFCKFVHASPRTMCTISMWWSCIFCWLFGDAGSVTSAFSCIACQAGTYWTGQGKSRGTNVQL